MKTNEELLREEEDEEIAKTIALSIEEYNATKNNNNVGLEEEHDKDLQEAIRLSILANNTNIETQENDYNDSHLNIVKKNYSRMSYYLCNTYETTKNKTDVIDNKLFWRDIFKNYKGLFIVIKDYIHNLTKRIEKLNNDSNSSSSGSSEEDLYDSDNSSDSSRASSLSFYSLNQVKKNYQNIRYTTEEYCNWLRKGNRSKCLNDYVFVNYILTEMKLCEDATEIHGLVFGVDNYKLVHEKEIQNWCNHNFTFNEHREITFGLRQFLNGPCGVISSVQSYIIINLLFNYKYNFLWQSNYFSVLKSNKDYLNFTSNNMASRESEEKEKTSGIPTTNNHETNEGDNLKVPEEDSNSINGNFRASESYGSNTDLHYDKDFLEMVCDNIRDLKYYSLVESLAYILYQCTERSYYVVAFLIPECYDYDYFVSKKKTKKNDIRDLKKISLYYKEFNAIKDVIKFYMEHFILYTSPTGVISFLYSVILTRGLDNIRKDMDDTKHPLIGIYGHCTQELVNMFLTGRACSNVFDNTSVLNTSINNDVDISAYESNNHSFEKTNEQQVHDTDKKGNNNSGKRNDNETKQVENKEKGGESENGNTNKVFNKDDNVVLKGISKRPLIGLLTDFEAFKYCEVGNFYKYPIYPIWVISSFNHYTVLFSLNIRNSKCTSEELFLERLNKVWKKYDKENNKYILSKHVPHFIEELDLRKQYLNTFGGFTHELDVLLYSDFKQFYLQMKKKEINELRKLDPPREKYFYLYDAKEKPEKCIHYFLLTEVDYEVMHTNYLKFFNTRWPNNTVEILDVNRKGRTRN